MTQEASHWEAMAQTRRRFMQAVGGTAGLAAVGSGAASLADVDEVEGTVGALSFYSPGSFLNENEEPLEDDEVALVRAEPEAFNFESADGPLFVEYPEDVDIPVVTEDTEDPVVGLSSTEFVTDDQGGFDEDNEMFLVNLFDEKIDAEGDPVVAWDEGHGQFFTLDDYTTFEAYADDEGYDLQATTNLLGGAALAFPSTASQVAPSGEDPLTDPEQIVVWAEPTAENVDEEGDGAVIYDDDTDIPLVSKDGNVVGFGTPELVIDGEITDGNGQFLLNVLAETTGGSGTLVWDDAHDTFYGSGDFSEFADTIEGEGYEFVSSGESIIEDPGEPGEPTLDELEFFSTSSILDGDGEVLTDEERIAVWAEPTAENADEAGDGFVEYPADVDIPLVGVDGGVVTVGSDFASDGSDEDANRTMLVNAWEDRIGGTGTVLYDETHGQNLPLDAYSELVEEAEGRGFTVESITEDFEGALADADAVMVASDDDDLEAFTDAELDALADFVADGGGLFLHNTSDFGGNAAAELNDVLTAVGADLGFNTDQVVDEENSGFAPFVPRTGNFNEEFDFFAAEPTVETTAVDELEFFSTASLLDVDETLLTDEERIAVWAEPTAENVDEAGDGFVEYPADVDIPLVGVDGTVVGVGSEFAPDASDEDANREMLVNAWEDRLGGTGTVLYDETHGQNLPLDAFSELVEEAEGRGFTVESITEDFEGALADADAVMVASDDDDLEAFTDAELDALADFVADDGGLFLHDTADFGGDSTDVLNDVLTAVGADLRFNTDQVVDEENSGFAPFVPRTSNFNEADYPGFFGDEEQTPGTIEAADVVAIPSPADAYTQEELDALSAHVDEGGAVLLFDESEFANEETENLNEIADELDLGFAFNPDQVEDDQNNAGVSFVPTTTNFNEGFDLFDGIDAVGFDDADAVAITSPSDAFTEAELDELEAFVADGGAVFLFHQSDFLGNDETANFNEIAEALDLDFRFNSDQINDEQNNTGSVFDIATANYDADRAVFEERENGVGIEFERDEEYIGRIVRVFDGDTFEVEFEDSDYGFRDVIRHIGIDTAETGAAENETEEWFGIPDDELDHLNEWGGLATDFSLDLMTPEGTEPGEEDVEGRFVKMTFDEDEPLRGNFGRLLMYMEYDPDEFEPDPPESGDYTVDYNRETIEEGYARVYSSGFSKHDDYAADEEAALAEGLRVWEAADFDAMTEFRTGFVDEVFVPRPSSVTTTDGPLGDEGPVEPILHASETTEQEPLNGGDGGFDPYDSHEDAPPLAAVDTDNRVGMFGGVLVHEIYEDGDDDDITDEYDLDQAGNFPLFTNTVELLSDNDGPFILEGGHGQFNVEGSVSLERVQFYLRHVEGLSSQIEGDARLRQINDLVETLPAEPEDPRVVFLTAPNRDYTEAELDALAEFRDGGGAVILVGSAAPDEDARARLNDIAEALGTELRLNDDRLVDESGPIEAEDLLVTDNVDAADGLRLPVNLDRSFVDTGVMAALNNVGADAWTLDAASEGVGPLDEDNPTLSLPEGRRIHVENRGAGPHPLAIRDDDGTALLTQDGEGTFEDDPDVEWVDTGDVVEFTLTTDLAEAVATYGCEVHGAMEGDIEVVAPQPPALPGQENPPQDLDGDGLFEDITGDGELTIVDVQVLFENLDAPEVQDNAAAFDFAGTGGRVSVFDVQALFTRLS